MKLTQQCCSAISGPRQRRRVLVGGPCPLGGPKRYLRFLGCQPQKISQMKSHCLDGVIPRARWPGWIRPRTPAKFPSLLSGKMGSPGSHGASPQWPPGGSRHSGPRDQEARDQEADQELKGMTPYWDAHVLVSTTSWDGHYLYRNQQPGAEFGWHSQKARWRSSLWLCCPGSWGERTVTHISSPLGAQCLG